MDVVVVDGMPLWQTVVTMDGELDQLLQAAQWMGAHASTVYGLVLLVVLAGTAAGYRWGRPVTGRLRNRAVVPAGLLVIASCAVFGGLAWTLRTHPFLAQADLVLSNAVEVHTPAGVVRAFGYVTHLADRETLWFYALAGPLALLLAGRRALALTWFMAVAGNGALNTLLKHVYERARPLQADGRIIAEGFSFPSGHSSGSLVTFGVLVYVGFRMLAPRWHLPLLLFAVAVVITVGTSRIILRAHFPSDVLAGYSSGAAWLTVCITVAEFWRRRLDRLPA